MTPDPSRVEADPRQLAALEAFWEHGPLPGSGVAISERIASALAAADRAGRPEGEWEAFRAGFLSSTDTGWDGGSFDAEYEEDVAQLQASFKEWRARLAGDGERDG